MEEKQHPLIRIIAYAELVAMIFILLIKSVFFAVLLLLTMYLFETIGLSFLFKDFFLVKMINIQIPIYVKYGLSLCFSGLAAFFVISVILYTKLQESDTLEEEDVKGKKKQSKISPFWISVSLGIVIFIGYIKGYPLSGLDVYGNIVTHDISFYLDLTLHVVSGGGISFFSVYVNYLIAEKIKTIQASHNSMSLIFAKYKGEIKDLLENKDKKVKSKKEQPRGGATFRRIPKAS